MKFKFVEGGKVRFTIASILDEHKDQVRSVCGNDNFFATGSYDNKIITFRFNPETNSFELENTFSVHEGYVVHLEYIPETDEIVSVSHDKTMKVINAKKGDVVTDFGVIHLAPVSALHVSHLDFKEILTGSWDHTCKIFHKDTKEVKIILNHEHNVLSVLKMDDEFVVTACADSQVYVWNKNYEIVHTLSHHTLCVRSLDFTFDEERKINGFVSSANDGYLKLYNKNYELIDSIHAHDNMILSVKSWNQLLLTTSEDQEAHIYRKTEEGKYTLECVMKHPKSVWDGTFLCPSQSSTEIPEVVTVSADGNSYVWSPMTDTQQVTSRIEPKVTHESKVKMKKLFLLQTQEDHGIVPSEYEKFESVDECLKHLSQVTSEQKTENYLKHGEFRFFSVDDIVKIFVWDAKVKKEWSFLSNFIELPNEEEFSIDQYDDDDGYESPTEEVDLEMDELHDNRYKFVNRRLQISFHGVSSIFEKDIKDFKICDDCGMKVNEYYHCFECVHSVDICRTCFTEKKTKSRYHLHDNTDYFSFVDIPRYKKWFNLSAKFSRNCKEFIQKCFHYYTGRPCIGTRKSTKDPYEWMTYDQVREEVDWIQHGLSHLGVEKGKFVGIISAPSHHYICIDLGCVLGEFVSVPIQRVLSVEKKESIIRSTKLKCLFITEEYVEELVEEILFNEKIDKISDLQLIIILPSMEESADTKPESVAKLLDPKSPYKTVRFEEFVSQLKGSCPVPTKDEQCSQSIPEGPVPKKVPPCEGKGREGQDDPKKEDEEEERIITIVHTSGTTSLPKGIVFRERTWMYYLRRECRLEPLVVMGLFPFSHNSGRFDFLMTFCNGGRIALVTDPGMTSFLDDCRVINPTILSLVPRVMNFVYGLFKDETSTEYTKQLKSQRIITDENEKEEMMKSIKTKVFKKYQKMNVFGSRIADLSVGGAKSSPKIKRFFRKLLRKPCYDTFGSTEVGLISFNFTYDPSRHKLQDCSPLGYFGTDLPFPRGELLVKVDRPVEYFGQPPPQKKEKKTKKPETEEQQEVDDGKDEESKKEEKEEVQWYSTGDIVEIRGNKMLVIDRKSNIVKGPSGEYISLETVENVLTSSCPSIHQMILFASSVALVGIIVPSSLFLDHQQSKEEETEGEDDDDSSSKSNIISSTTSPDHHQELKDRIMTEIQSVGKSHPLNLWEIPSGVIITKDHFTHENGLLTVTKKKIRRKILAKYNSQLSKLIEDQNKTLTSSSSIQEFIYNILGVKVVQDDDDNDNEENDLSKTFVELGGDSLTAIRVMNELKRRGLEISYKDLRETPISNIFSRMNKIDEENDTGSGHRKSKYVTFENEQKEIEELMKSLKKERLSDSTQRKISTIFLTGSTGFLGQFILRDVLTVFSDDVKVVCLVRSRRSIQKVKKIVDHFEKKRIEFVLGDLSLAKFGLSNEEFGKIVEETDVIIHNGAMVNHFLSYEDHYDANVRSLQDIISISEGFKPIIFVSSVSVYPHQAPKKKEEKEKKSEEAEGEEDEELEESDDCDLIKNSKHLRKNGYSTSKWVSDCLCEGLPNAIIVRPSLIFGEIGGKMGTRTDDQSKSTMMNSSNLKDWMNIFIKVMIKHKLLPSTNLDNHLDLVPVDYISFVISRLSVQSYDLISSSDSSKCTRKFNLSIKNVQVKQIVDSIHEFLKLSKEQSSTEEEEETVQLLPFHMWIKEVEKRENIGDPNKSEILPFIRILRSNQRIGDFYNDFVLNVGGQQKNQKVLNEQILSGYEGNVVYSKENLKNLVKFIREEM